MPNGDKTRTASQSPLRHEAPGTRQVRGEKGRLQTGGVLGKRDGPAARDSRAARSSPYGHQQGSAWIQ